METKSPADLSYQQSEPREVWADQRPAPGWTGPPPAYSEAVPDSVNVNVVHIVTPVLYGDQPVQTVCPHCHAQIVTMTSSDTSVTAWLLAGLLCALGLWLCAPLPLCSDSKDVTHRCPACNRVVARCKGGF